MAIRGRDELRIVKGRKAMGEDGIGVGNNVALVFICIMNVFEIYFVKQNQLVKINEMKWQKKGGYWILVKMDGDIGLLASIPLGLQKNLQDSIAYDSRHPHAMHPPPKPSLFIYRTCKRLIKHEYSKIFLFLKVKSVNIALN